MIRVRSLAIAGLLTLTVALPSFAQRRRPAPEPPPEPEPPSDVRVRSTLSQSAAWVGDPIDFVIEIEAAPGIEMVAEDLATEKLLVEGLELGPATASTELLADGWRLNRYSYRVTAWDTPPPHRIGELTVRFRRPVTTATADGSSPGAEIKVPGATLAVRSTLPDDGSPSGTRDRQGQLPPPSWLAWLRPGGLGLIVVGIAPVVLWLAAFARRPRATRPRPSSRSLNAHAKSLFDELAIIDTTTADGRRRAYDRIDSDVRSYLAEAEGVPAPALTAEELRPRLANSSRVSADAVCDILAECEHARYAPETRLPDADTVGASIARLRSALGG